MSQITYMYLKVKKKKKLNSSPSVYTLPSRVAAYMISVKNMFPTSTGHKVCFNKIIVHYHEYHPAAFVYHTHIACITSKFRFLLRFKNILFLFVGIYFLYYPILTHAQKYITNFQVYPPYYHICFAIRPPTLYVCTPILCIPMYTYKQKNYCIMQIYKIHIFLKSYKYVQHKVNKMPILCV